MNSSKYKLPYPAKDLIPHRESMLLIKDLKEFSRDSGETNISIKENNLFIKKDGNLDPIVFVEFLAQLSAAHSGYEAILDASAKKEGFLVGIKNLQIYKTARLGDDLRLRIKKETSFEQFTLIGGYIYKGNDCLAEGTLKLWEQESAGLLIDESELMPKPPKNFDLEGDNTKGIVDTSVLNKEILENLYVLNVSKNKTEAIADLFFNENFTGFKGHFPGSPLLPGVMMLKTGLLLSGLVLETPLVITKIKYAKFTKSVFPNELIQVKINISKFDKSYKLDIKIVNDNTICSKFSLTAIKDVF